MIQYLLILLAAIATGLLTASAMALLSDWISTAKARLLGCPCERIGGIWWFRADCPVHKNQYLNLP